MSTFHFRLAAVLRLRLAERDERRGGLVEALTAAQNLLRQRQALDAEQQHHLALLRALAAPGSGNVRALIHAHCYDAVLKGRSARLADQEAEAQCEVERERAALVEADRQVRVLEKLEQRQAAEHQRQTDKLEAGRLDEVAVRGYLRQRRA